MIHGSVRWYSSDQGSREDIRALLKLFSGGSGVIAGDALLVGVTGDIHDMTSGDFGV